MMTIVGAFAQYYPITVSQLALGKKVLPEHLHIANKTQDFALGFMHISGSSFTSRIKNFNQLVLHHKKIQFRLMRDQQEPAIKGDVGQQEIARLSAAPNGQYVIMDRDDRIIFECLHELITDFVNHDLNFKITLPELVNWIAQKLPDYWLVQTLSQ